MSTRRTSSPNSAGTRTTPTRSSRARGRPRRAAVDVALTAWRAVVDGEAARVRRCAARPAITPRPIRSRGTAILNNAAIAAQAGSIAARASRSSTSTSTTATAPSSSSTTVTTCCSSRSTPIRRDDYPYFLGLRRRTGLGRGRGLHAELPARARHRLVGLRARARSRDCRGDEVRARSAWSSRWASTPRSRTPTRSGSSAADYPRIGAAIGGLARPTVFVQEGGYDLDVLGRNVVYVLRAAESA